MNNKQIKELCNKKGVAYTFVGGLLRVQLDGVFTFPTTANLALIALKPDYVSPAEKAKEQSIDLRGMNQEQRDAILLKMMNSGVPA